MNTISILGAGSWGTAIASVLSQKGHTIKLWCREPEVVQSILQTKENQQYLPNISLSSLIEPTNDLEYAICDAQYIFEAVPIKYLRHILEQSKDYFSSHQIFVILSKGIEQNSLMLPTQIVDDVLGKKIKKAVIAGPSFARDLAQKQITAVTLAAQDCTLAQELQKVIATDYFRPYISQDIVGVQVGAAIKNVITLAIGLLKGAGYNENVQAYILTRGLREMVQLATILGAKQETLYGLSGMGDLVLTAMGSSSKNLTIAKELGKGKTLEQLAQTFKTLPEGINTLQSTYQIFKKYNLDLPVCLGTYSIIFERQKIDAFLNQLMARPLEKECL